MFERKWQFDGFRWDGDDAIRKCLEELSITTYQFTTGPDRSILFLDQPRSRLLDGKLEPPGIPRLPSLTLRFFNGVGEITGVTVRKSDWELHDAKIKTTLSHLRNVRRLDVPERPLFRPLPGLNDRENEVADAQLQSGDGIS